MRCPFCRHDDSRALDSRPADEGGAVRRRHSCPSCNRRSTTGEVALLVEKRSSATDPFSRQKVITGVREACQGRPVSEDALALTDQRVKDAVRPTGRLVVTTHGMGTAILVPLQEFDEVSYRRLASVYRGFTSPRCLEGEVRHPRAGPREPKAGRQ
ncbi:NrdR family transcriptional regulator [Micromonospora sp. CA-244673]|uniref:NrdR family transcriptional regulator n=1 Tax=Micromonospora sp. CA-244673 TaxID=3239958 RepID=UPI003D8EDC67